MTSDTQAWLMDTFSHTTGPTGANGDAKGARTDAVVHPSADEGALEEPPPGMELEALASTAFDCFDFSYDQYIVGLETMFRASGALTQLRVPNATLRAFLLGVRCDIIGGLIILFSCVQRWPNYIVFLQAELPQQHLPQLSPRFRCDADDVHTLHQNAAGNAAAAPGDFCTDADGRLSRSRSWWKVERLPRQYKLAFGPAI
eukprot:SAG31_NODE_6053_length_2190_cov_3.450024_3_plen_201_part_00